jgi:hypothetical protein
VRSSAIASDLFEAGWLSPRAAAARLGIDVEELQKMFKRGTVRRRSLAPGVYLYDVGGSR